MVLLSSFGLGAWAVYEAVNPWAGSVLDVRQLERKGPHYYWADARSGALYALVGRVREAVNRKDSDRALALIDEGRKLAPESPIFDYLAAVLAHKCGDRASMLKAIDGGNAKGVLRAYVPDSGTPDDWQWAEIVMIARLGTTIAAAPDADRAELVSVLKMAQKMAWCEPPEPERLLLAVEVRAGAARALATVARREGDEHLARTCDELIEEANQIRFAEDRHILHSRGESGAENRAWILSRAIGNQAQGSRKLLLLFLVEKRAEWADGLRREYLRTRNVAEMGPGGTIRQ